MHDMKPGSRIKYYRNLLGISQGELAGKCFSVSLIYFIESGKRGLTVTTATILINRLNEIAEKKGIELVFKLRELMMTDEEYAACFCLDRLANLSNDVFCVSEYMSLMNIANEYNLNKIKYEVYNKFIDYYRSINDFKEEITYLQKKLELKLNSVLERANILCRIGTCHYLMGKFDVSISYYLQGYDICKANRIIDVELLAKLLYNLALCNARLKKFQMALEYTDINLSLKLSADELIDIYILRAGILIDLARYEEALLIYETIVKGGYEKIYIVQNNMAYALKCLGKIDDSIQYFTESINNQLKSPSIDTTLSLAGIASVYKKEGKLKIAITFYEYAIKNALSFKQYEEVLSFCSTLYEIYQELSKPNLFSIYYFKLIDYCKNNLKNENFLKGLEFLNLTKFNCMNNT